MAVLEKDMIIRIDIKDVASFDIDGVSFDNMQKVNFIYGGNGTGKTTISRYLAGPDNYIEINKPKGEVRIEIGNIGVFVDKNNSLGLIDKKPEKRDLSIFKNCSIEWIGRHEEVVVYNLDFKKRNLTEIMPGVFSLGPSVAEEMKRRRYIDGRIKEWENRGKDTTELRKRYQEGKKGLLNKKGQYSVQPCIDYINKTLSRIGFSGFKLKTSTENPYSYEIVRKNGEMAGETLSEGEATIITFLYYLQQIEGIGSGNKPYGQKIAVIDDPISSLDYDAIEVVSTLTNELMENARRSRRVEQVIVLTHNATFHQSLSVRQPKEETKYWKLYKKRGVSTVTDCGAENPVMGDYERLWMKLRTGVDVTGLPNLMRNIIETYFVDNGGYNKRKLLAGAYIARPEDKRTIEALGKWIDEGSHSIKDNLFSGDEEALYERYMDAFRLLFETMGQEAHYKMMMRI